MTHLSDVLTILGATISITKAVSKSTVSSVRWRAEDVVTVHVGGAGFPIFGEPKLTSKNLYHINTSKNSSWSSTVLSVTKLSKTNRITSTTRYDVGPM